MSGSVWYLSVSKKKIEFKRYPKKPKNKKKNRNKSSKIKNYLFYFIFFSSILFSNLISAAEINDTFHINVQTTFPNATIQSGTFAFAFNITESSSASCLGPIVYNHSTSTTTDARGIVSIYLPTIGSGGGNLTSLSFDKQYYLCYYRDGTLKDISQLGRVPYSFRATQVNLSEVNINSNLTLGNFNISASSGFFSFLGSLTSRITTLFVQNINASGDVNISGIFRGNGSALTNVNSDLLDGRDSTFFMPLNTSVFGSFDFNGGWQNNGISISGGSIFAQQGYFVQINSLNVTNLNTNGTLAPILDNQFDLGNSSNRYRNLFVATNVFVNGTVFSGNNNLTIPYLLTTNNTFAQLGQLNNGTYALYQFVGNSFNGTGNFNTSGQVNGSTVYSGLRNLTIPYYLTTNNTFAQLTQLNNGTYVIASVLNNGTYIVQSVLNNGTYFLTANWNATNTSYLLDSGDTATGNYTFDSGTFFIDSTNHFVGINTTTPSATFNVKGGAIFNLTSGNDFRVRNLTTLGLFVVNGTTGNVGIGAPTPGAKLHINATDNTTLPLQIQGLNTTGGLATWLTVQNATGNVNITSNLTIGNGTLFFEIYNSGSGIFFDTKGNNAVFTDNLTAGVINGTTVYSGNNNLTISYFLTTNNTFAQLTQLNNGTYVISSVLNNGTYITQPVLNNGTYVIASVLNNGTYIVQSILNNGTYVISSVLNNGTYVIINTLNNGTFAKTNAANTFGGFNQTFNTSLLQLDVTRGRVGINTTDPANTLTVFGDINGTTVYSGNNNLTIPYFLTTNNTFAQLTQLNNGTYVIASVLNNGTYALYQFAGNSFNGTGNFNTSGQVNGSTVYSGLRNLTIPYYLTTNNTFAQLTQLNNGTYIVQSVLNNGTYIVQSVLNNGTYFLTANWNATNTSYYLASNPSGFFHNISNFTGNLTNNKFCIYNSTDNKIWCNSTSSETDPFWSANYSAFLVSYGLTTNATFLQISNWNATNTSYLLDSGDTATGNYTFDTNTFHIDSTRDRIGIGLTNPLAKLHVNATDNTTTPLQIQGLNATGGAATWLFVQNATGNVGINTTTPQNALNVLGDGNFSGSLLFYGEILPDGLTCADGEILKKTGANNWDCATDATLGGGAVTGAGTAGYIPQWNGSSSLNNSNIFQNGSSVGINLTTPQNTLNVLGDINGTTVYSGNFNLSIAHLLATNNTFAQLTQLNNGTYVISSVLNNGTYFLTANWNATNTSYLLDSGDTATGNYTFDTNTFFIDSTRDRIGIGLTNPSAKLDVNATDNTTTPFQIQGFNATGALVTHLFVQNVTGNVLLGTASIPGQYRFEVGGGADSVTQVVFSGASTALHFTPTSSTYRIGTFTSGKDLALESGNAVEAIRIKSGGNVGIGVTTPLAKLHINTTDNTTNVLQVQGFNVTGALVTHLFVQNASGNVGIGTASPLSKLEVNASPLVGTDGYHTSAGAATLTYGRDIGVGAGSTEGYDLDKPILTIRTPNGLLYNASGIQTALLIEAQNRFRGQGIGVAIELGATNFSSRITNFGDNANSFGSRLQLQTHNATGLWNAGIKIYEDGTVTLGNFNDSTSPPSSALLSLWANTSSSPLVTSLLDLVGSDGSSSLLRVLNNGSVGINTTSPVNKLNVVGDINATTSIFSFNKNLSTGYDLTTNNTFLQISNFNVTNTSYLLDSGDTASGNYTFDTNTFFIDSTNDRVGVGTTTPATKLYVAGNITSDEGSTAGALFFGNSNHGVRRLSGTNNIELFTTTGNISLSSSGAGGNQVTILSSGNVGIGNSSPVTKLVVAGNIYPDAEASYDLGSQSGPQLNWRNAYFSGNISANGFVTNGGQLSLYAGCVTYGTSVCSGIANNVGEIIFAGGGNILQYIARNPDGQGQPAHAFDTANNTTQALLAIRNFGSEKLRVTANGSIGIGTTSPLTLIHLNASDTSNTSVTNLLTLDHVTSVPGNGTAGIGTGILFRTEDSQGEIENASQIQAFLTTATNASEVSALTFFTRTSGGNLTERLRISGNGNVGINTTNPQNTLNVVGALNVSNISGFTALLVDGTTGSVSIGTTGSTQNLSVAGVIRGQSIAQDGDVLEIGNDAKLRDIGVANTAGLWGIQDSTVGALSFGSSAGTLITSVSGASSYFNNAGKVGIGTATPGARLEVSGDVNISGIANVTGTIYSGNNNLTIPYLLTTNNTFAQLGQLNNGTYALYQFAANNFNGTGYFNTSGQVNGSTVYSGLRNLTIPYYLTTNNTFLQISNWNATNTSYLLDSGDTATGNYTFDTNTFFIDSTRDRIGIGTTDPQTKLHVNATDNTTNVSQIQGLNTTGGLATWFSIRNATGSVGIGTASPVARLEVDALTNPLQTTAGGGQYGVLINAQGSALPSAGSFLAGVHVQTFAEPGVPGNLWAIRIGQPQLSGGVNISDFRGLLIDGAQTGGIGTGNITTAYGIRIGSINAANGSNYGLVIDDISGGLTAYAIKTGTGDISFGDDVNITGIANVSGTVFALNKNLSIGYELTTNNTFAQLGQVNNGTYALYQFAGNNFNGTGYFNTSGQVNGSTVYSGLRNLTIPYYLTTNNTFAQLTQLNNGTYVIASVLNNGTYIVQSVLNNGTYFLTANWNATNTSYLLDSGDTATGNYTFDTNTFFIDSTNDRVGIGITNPSAKLNVNATDNTTTVLQIQGFNATGASVTHLFVQNATGNVGIKTASPVNALTVFGDINGTTVYSGNNNLTIPYFLTTNNTFAQLTQLNNGTYIIASVLNNGTYIVQSVLNNGTYITQPVLNNGTYVISSVLNNGSYFNTLTGSVTGAGTVGNIPMWNGTTSLNNSLIYQNGSLIGIGTTIPAAKLHINTTDNTTTPLQIQGLNATGVLSTWVFVQNSTGNIGIGTSSPIAPLHIIGNLTLGNTAGPNTGTIQFDSGDRFSINRPIQFGATSSPQIRATATIIINAEGDAQNIELRTATNGDIFFTTNTSIERARIKSTNGNFGINTTTPQNTLNVLGDINGTLTIYSFNKNLSIGYDLTTNNTFAQLTQLNNGTYVVASVLNNGSYFNSASSDSFAGNYTNFSAIYAIGTNNTFAQWQFTSNNFNGTGYFNTSGQVNGSTVYSGLRNLTIPYYLTTNNTFAQLTQLNNGTYFLTANWNATNTSYLLDSGDTATGNYTFDTNTFFIDSTRDRIGIGITDPQAKLHVNATDNTTTPLQIQGFNSTGSSVTHLFVQNASGNVGIKTASPVNALTVFGDINGTTVYSGNFNLSIAHLLATNNTFTQLTTLNNGTYITQPVLNNGTYIITSVLNNGSYFNSASSGDISSVNTTLDAYLYNGSDSGDVFLRFNETKLNLTTYALLSQLNNGTYVVSSVLNNGTYVIINTLNNGTFAKTNVANTFGGFNQTFNTSLLHLDVTRSRVGINTTDPQNTLNVFGDINGTTVYSGNFNLSIAHLLATNNTFAQLTTLNNGTYITQPVLNNGTYIITSVLNNGSYFNSASSDSFAGNYTNFSAIYAIGTNNTFAQLTQLNNGTYVIINTLNNGTFAKTDASNTFGAFNQTFDTNTLFIDSTRDRIGIGLTNPSAKLDINVTDNTTALLQIQGFNTTGVGFLSTWLLIQNGTGNIGLGTTTPNNIIDIVHSNPAQGALRIYSAVSNPGVGIDLFEVTAANTGWNNTVATITGSGTGDVLRLVKSQSSVAGKVLVVSDINKNTFTVDYHGGVVVNLTAFDNTTTPFQIIASNATGNLSTWFFIQNSTGRVGINLTTPQNALNVFGEINATASIFSFNKNLSIGYDLATNNTFAQLTQLNNGTYVISSVLNNGTYVIIDTLNNGTFAKTNAANTFGGFNQTFNTSLFHLDVTRGRVGIGTANPTSKFIINTTDNTTSPFEIQGLNSTGSLVTWLSVQNVTGNVNITTANITTQGSGTIYSNSSCVKIKGATSLIEVC